MSRLTRFGVACLHLAVWIVVGSAAPAAARMPARVDLHVEPKTDLAAIEESLTRLYPVTFRRMVAADIDRDGDLDLVAATDHGVLVWINDGQGHLTRQMPRSGPAIEGRSSSATKQEIEPRSHELIQNDVPALCQPPGCSDAPPVVLSSLARPQDATLHPDPSRGHQVPRAPPV